MNQHAAPPKGDIVAVSDLHLTLASDAGDVNILRGLSFTITHGESVALAGPSGSGKSTLLGLMAGLDQASSGSVVLAGENLAGLDEDARAVLRGRLLGFVFQTFQLLPSLNAIENVMLPLELAGAANARAEAERWLQRVGLAHRLRHYPKHLSGGEQQRVALARAFARGPRLLLADEPTGNLDPKTADHVFATLATLVRATRLAALVATHNMDLAARMDRRVTLRDGLIEELA